MLRRAAILMSGVVLVASACSGSNASSGDASATSPYTLNADAALGSVTTARARSDTAESVDTVEGSGGSEAGFCAAISAIQSAEFELEETFGPEARRLFDDVQTAAPPEVIDDVAVVIDTLEAIAELGISTDENDPEAIDAAFEILLDPDYTEANEHLQEYTSDVCGIDLGDGDDTDLDGLELEDLEG